VRLVTATLSELASHLANLAVEFWFAHLHVAGLEQAAAIESQSEHGARKVLQWVPLAAPLVGLLAILLVTMALVGLLVALEAQWDQLLAIL